MAFHILMVEDDRQICEVVEDFFAGKSGGELKYKVSYEISSEEFTVLVYFG